MDRNQFFKAHCLGNDYIVLWSEDLDFELTPANIRRICDRHRGLGSDGVLLDVGTEDRAFGVRIFNPDGSEAEKSGNGLRILACYLFATGWTSKTEFEISTKVGLANVNLQLNGRGDVVGAAIAMGQASFSPASLPCTLPVSELVLQPIDLDGGTYEFTGVSVGNPHCVIFAEDDQEWKRRDLLLLGPAIEHHPIFPNRVNVQLAKVENSGTVRILIWERGVGETEASGTSACAVAAAAVKQGLVKGTVSVHAPGGTQYVDIDPSFQVVLTGPVKHIAGGWLSEPFLAELVSNAGPSDVR